MKTIFFVDDEELVLEWLHNTINWEELGIHVAGQSSNSTEALERIKECKPNILITDIYMPGINGIQMIKQLKEILPSMKVIVLSGYADFQYAQQALQYGAEDYLLKPIDNDKVIDVINRVARLLDKEMEERKERELLRKQVHESLPALKEKFLCEFLSGIYNPDYVTEEMLKSFNLDGKVSFAVILVNVDKPYEYTKENNGMNKLISFYEIKNICMEVLNEYMLDTGLTVLHQGEIVCILKYYPGMPQPLEKSPDPLRIAMEIQERVENKLKLKTTIAISNRYEGVSAICRCYEEACNAIKHKLLRGPGSIIHIQDIMPVKHVLPYPIDYERRLLNAISSRDQATAITKLEELFSYLRKENINSIAFLQRLCLEITAIAGRMAYNIGGSMEEAFGKDFNPIVGIMNCDTLDAFFSYLKNIILTLINYIDSKNISKTKSIISRAVEYIKDNFAKDISIDEIAEYIGISNNYFSLLFKQEMGVNFVDFLTSYRIEMAKKLLANKEFKVYEIGEKVGYSNSKYFSQVFKKITGMSPADYRNFILE